MEEKSELKEKVVAINRVAKVVKGGRTFRFSAVVVVGHENGHVGVGNGKAAEVPDAIKKAIQEAKKNLVEVPVVDTTVPHEYVGTLIAKRAIEKNIKTVVYDRGGYIYHGIIKELEEAAREAGLEF